MLYNFRIILLLLILSSCTKSIVILYESDVHCAIDNYDKISGLKNAIYSKDTSHVFLVSSGDFINGGFAGTFSRGAQIIQIMNTTGYSAVTLGNHEFDFGIQRMNELADSLETDIITTNITTNDTNRYKPYKIIEAGNKKIAFLGCITPSASSNNNNYVIHSDDMAEIIQKKVNTVRELGADYVILLSHLGEDSTAINCKWTSIHLINDTYGIDAVIDGHSHNVINDSIIKNKKGYPVHLTQTGSKMHNLGKMWISGSEIQTGLIPVKSIPYSDNKVKEFTDSIRKENTRQGNKKIGFTKYDLTMSNVRTKESNLGNLVADAMSYTTGAEIAFINGASFRNNIDRGNITKYDILNTLIYSDFIYKIKLPGSKIKEFLTAAVNRMPNRSVVFPQVNGIRFTIDLTKETPSIKKCMIFNKEKNCYNPINDDTLYEVAIVDFYLSIYKDIFADSEEISYGKKLRDSECLIKYIQEKLNGEIPSEYAKLQGRIKITTPSLTWLYKPRKRATSRKR